MKIIEDSPFQNSFLDFIFLLELPATVRCCHSYYQLLGQSVAYQVCWEKNLFILSIFGWNLPTLKRKASPEMQTLKIALLLLVLAFLDKEKETKVYYITSQVFHHCLYLLQGLFPGKKSENMKLYTIYLFVIYYLKSLVPKISLNISLLYKH